MYKTGSTEFYMMNKADVSKFTVNLRFLFLDRFDALVAPGYV